MPCVTLILHVLMVSVYDVDSPDPSRNRWLMILEAVVWNLLLQGLLQPIVALVVSIIVCPFIAFCILSGKAYSEQLHFTLSELEISVFLNFFVNSWGVSLWLEVGLGLTCIPPSY